MRTPRVGGRPQVLRLLAAFTVAVVVLVLGGLGSEGRSVPAYHHYVALGDSFTAAPFVPLTDRARGCLRSSQNYPRLVAAALQIGDLRDRSCTGANTANLITPQLTSSGQVVRPQLDAVHRDTDLVTLGIGFNNQHLYARMNTDCRRTTALCPLFDQRAQLAASVGQVKAALVVAIEEIRHRAPHARILLVTYPKLLPEHGTCPALPTWRPEDRATYRDIQLRLRDQMRAAALQTRVEFVDFYRASIGHDICSSDPWVQGRVGQRFAGAAMHPLAAGEAALARIIVDLVRQPPPLPVTH